MRWDKLIGISEIINGLSDIKKKAQTKQQNQTNKLKWLDIQKHGMLDIHGTRSVVWKALVEEVVVEEWGSVTFLKG